MKSEQGFVLIVALLALLAVTIIGVLALSTSTTDVIIAANERLREINLSGAESGLEISDPAIRYIVGNQALGNYAEVVNDANLVSELRGGSFDPTDSCTKNPDLRLSLANMTVSVDIDRMSAGLGAGSAIEFASGYEGIGTGGRGGIEVYYRVNSMSREAIGSERCLGGVYRYVAY